MGRDWIWRTTSNDKIASAYQAMCWAGLKYTPPLLTPIWCCDICHFREAFAVSGRLNLTPCIFIDIYALSLYYFLITALGSFGRDEYRACGVAINLSIFRCAKMVRLLRICIWVFIVPTYISYQVCKQFRAHTHYQISARLTPIPAPHAALFSATPPLHLLRSPQNKS